MGIFKVYAFNELVELVEEGEHKTLVKWPDSTLEWVSNDEITKYVESPLKSKKPLKTRSRIKPNRKRKAKNFKKHFGSKERVQAVNQMPCVGCGSRHAIVNAHIKSRGAGGTYQDIVPMCQTCHDLQHRIGNTAYEEKYQVNLKVEALKVSKILDST